MPNFIVELRYPNGSVFETRCAAHSDDLAKQQAIAESKQLGFNLPITKAIVIGCRHYQPGEHA